MRRFTLLLALASSVAGQTAIDLKTQTRNVDFSGAASTKPVQTGTSVPPTCSTGQMYFNSALTPGTNLLGCNSGGWTPLAGGGAVSVQAGGSPVATRPTINFSAGTGVLMTVNDTGQAIAVQPSADLAVMQTLAGEQSGAALLCASVSGSPSAYTCSLSPTLTAYVPGMVLRWIPDVNGAGGAITLNVDTLGAVPLKLADGATDPPAGTLAAGQVQEVWYDGTNFRFLSSNSGGIAGITVQNGGTTVGTSSTLNFSAGIGSLLTISNTGQTISIQPSADLATIQTQAGDQSGSALLCASASGSASSYTCSMSPTLTAYSAGMFLHWEPDQNGLGGPTTLNVDTLGAASLKLADGVTDPGPSDIIAGRIQEVWYDGAVFRLAGAVNPSGVLGEPIPACSVATRGRMWFVAGASGVKDGLSVCAKDATNSYAWRSLY